MLRDYFPTALSFIWRPDNDGQPFHDTPHDPGGATNWGVTYSTWTGWQQLHKLPVSMDAFKALGKDDFQPLYRAQFWNSIRCSSFSNLLRTHTRQSHDFGAIDSNFILEQKHPKQSQFDK